jgi:hypothetical protein
MSIGEDRNYPYCDCAYRQVRGPTERFAGGATNKNEGGNMKSRILAYIAAMTVFAVLAIPAQLAAQNQPGQVQRHVRYAVTARMAPLNK